ncbi:MAG TPA: putative metal-binding motif-containing protein [Polyangiaceae bacterium]|nr:putative metal-binding motif-containing protein [Polyangiaceae bacterium]
MTSAKVEPACASTPGRALARTALGRSLALLILASATLGACGDHSAPSPFVVDAGEAGAPSDGGNQEGGLNVGVDAGDPTLGGPCSDDGQCDDAIACTTDTCDMTLLRCRHSPDDTQCDDGVYCNGPEVCDPKLGCGPGAPVSCSDNDSCTIDTCVEKDHSCLHSPRDEDGDGDPVWNCPGGGDCDDTDPTVSSKLPEICGNGKDDNCNGQIDEMPCVSPAYDTCQAPLLISTSGLTSLSLAGTALDYPTTCAPTGQNFHDVVVALSVPAGPAQDIDIVAQSAATEVSLGTANTCGDIASTSCSPSVVNGSGSLSRLHFYGLPAGNYPLYVAANQETDVDLSVKFSASSSPPSNETCGTATPLVPGTPVVASLVEAKQDLTSACYSDESGELVYAFELASAEDVRVFADPLDTYGVPELSLRDAHCSAQADELTCRVGTPASLFARALPAGQYFVSVGSTGPGDINVQLEESAPTAAPADEGCADPPPLALAQTVDLELSDHADAVNLGCLAGAPDSTHSLTLTQASDVLLEGASSNGDTVAVSLGLPSCAAATALACGLSTSTPIGAAQVFTSTARARAYGVPAGDYRVVAESAAGNPISLTAFARTAQPTTLVAFADDCSAPFEIPETGGHFQGNTANANADYDAGCDVGNQPAGGAPDQMLHLKLSSQSRVVFDMAGSSYSTMLAIRTGATCPGSEVPSGCSAGYVADRSFLDLDLASGDYYVQVDGYDGDSGAWSLDVYVAPDSL